MQARALTIGKMDNHTQPLFLAFSISMILHAVIITFLIVNPEFDRPDRDTTSVITVSMVNIPTSAPAAGKPSGDSTPKKTPPKEPPKEEAKAPAPQPKESATAPPVEAPAPRVKKVKRSLKKQTYKSKKVVDSAIKNLEKKVEKTQTDQRAGVFESLRRKVQEQEAARDKDDQDKIGSGESQGIGEGEGLTGQQRIELEDMYRLEIAFQIQKNWAFADQMAGVGNNLHASVIFKVMPNGEITDINFMDRSGNRVLDDSVYNALIKSSPVDPHPKGVVAPYVELGLNFTPEGVR